MNFTKSDIAAVLQNLALSDIAGNENLVLHLNEHPENTTHSRPYIVSIEGNIGAGKSTLLEKMRQIYSNPERCAESVKYFGSLSTEQILFMQEPVDQWTTFRDSVTGESILEKFYKDPKTYSLAFQVMAYNTMLQGFRNAVKETPECVLIICERSLDASRRIFSQMLRDDGMIDEVSFQIYMNMYDSNAGEFPLDAVLHLDVSPEVCLKRIGKRSRAGEDGISLEYLEKCDRYYKDWLYPLYKERHAKGVFTSPDM
jgi:deoxyadenosine/deoxycytidine kinase